MSRLAKNPLAIPNGVEVNVTDHAISVKGSKGALDLNLHPDVKVTKDEAGLMFTGKKETAGAIVGTMRALASNMLKGVSEGFEIALQLVGVGYRAQSQGKVLNLSLGFSHPVEFAVPEGITIETPSQTEILVKGIDRQAVGQVAANIRKYRPPEPYKGKGVKYRDEVIIKKEAKKK